MSRKVISVLTAVSLFLIIGCTKSDSPEQVADKFWDAMMEKDIDKARSLSTENSAGFLNEGSDRSGGRAEITFGEIITEDGRATVETTMRSTDGEMEMNIPMKTFLVLDDGEWKVEAQQTMMSMFGGAMGELMQGFGDAMKNTMKEMGKAMAEGMKEGMSESADGNVDEEMEQRMEEIMEQMEEGAYEDQ